MNENVKDIYIGNKRVKQIFRGGDLIYNRRVYLIQNGIINDTTILGPHRYNYMRDIDVVGSVTENEDGVIIIGSIDGNRPGNFTLEFSNVMPTVFKKIGLLFDVYFNKGSNDRITAIHNMYCLTKNEYDPIPNINMYLTDITTSQENVKVVKDIPILRNNTYFALVMSFYYRNGPANFRYKIKELYLE